MGEYAGVWLRVSTGGQDENNQLPEITKWVEDRGYEVAKTYTLHGASASKGKQQAQLDQVIADMAAGLITVLVVWASDRIERRGAFNAFALAEKVRAAGGRIEYVKDSYLNEVNEMSDVMLALAATRDKMESKRKSDRSKAVHGRIRQDGGVSSRAPWGYETSGQRYAKTFTPTTEGRRIVPEVYARVIGGESLATVAKWLENETSRSWWPTTVGKMIRNATYRGAVENMEGKVIHRCEPLVDARTWRLAGEALATRPKSGPRNAENRALLAGVLKCDRCDDSPMYRHGTAKDWYRCTGRGASRTGGCGKMVRVSFVDGVVGMLMRDDTRDIMETVVVPGHDYAAELEEIRYEIRSLATMDLSDDEYDERLSALRAERDRLSALPSVPDRIERRSTGQTYADKWRGMNVEERRSWLRTRGMTVRAQKGHVVVLDSEGVEIMEYVSRDGEVIPE